MSGVSLPHIPPSDTRSRKDLMANIVQALLGEPLSRLCGCTTLSEKDLLYNILLAAQQGGGGGGTPGAPVGSLQFNDGGSFGGVSGWSNDGFGIISGGKLYLGTPATPGSHDLAVKGTSGFEDTITISSVPNANPAIIVQNFTVSDPQQQSVLDLSAVWNTSGTPTGIKLNVTNTSSGSGSLLLDLLIDGSSVFKVAKSGAFTSTSNGSCAAMTLAPGGFLNFQGRSVIESRSDGTLLIENNANTDFTLLQFGGTTAAFPAIRKGSGNNTLFARLADDSDNTTLVFKVPTSNPGPGTLWNNGGTLEIGT